MKDMKPLLAGLLAALVLTAPVALAQEATAQAFAQSSTEVKSVTVFGLGLKQVGEAFGNFVFQVRDILTFDENAKLDLLRERNAEMKTQQQAWLDMKARLAQELKSGNFTAEEKKQLKERFRAEHEAIVKEHLALTAKLDGLKENARQKGETEVEAKAQNEEKEFEDANLSSGLSGDNSSDTDVLLGISIKANMTADDAKAIVEHELGFHTGYVRTVTRGNTTYYVVTGNETGAAGSYALNKGFEAWVKSDTGVISSLDLGTHLEISGGVR